MLYVFRCLANPYLVPPMKRNGSGPSELKIHTPLAQKKEPSDLLLLSMNPLCRGQDLLMLSNVRELTK